MERKKLKELLNETSALKGILNECIGQVDLILTRINELLEGEEEK